MDIADKPDIRDIPDIADNVDISIAYVRDAQTWYPLDTTWRSGMDSWGLHELPTT